MSLKQEIETWTTALAAYDAEDFEKALQLFSTMEEASKIHTNMGLIYATIGEHEAAVEQFNAATGLDRYLAVAYFQCGVSNFLLGRYENAHQDFEEALLYLRSNQAINYEQLGLKFKLFSAEVLFNKGLSLIYMGRVDEGLRDMEDARREKATDDHNVIDDAIADRGDGYTVFSIPVGVLYRPSESKVKNMRAKDYMGKAKLIAASDQGDAFTEFTGIARLRMGVTPSGVLIDRPPTDDGPGGVLQRSLTAPSPSTGPRAERPEPSLQRAKTTLTVPSDARERTNGLAAPPAAPMTRSNTMGSRPPPAGGMPSGPGMTRGLSVRKPVPGPAQPASAPGGGRQEPPAPSPPAKAEPSRLTEFYEDYIDSYATADEPVPPLPPATNTQDRVGAWARANANPPRAPLRSGPPSAYAASSFGGGSGSMRRKVTRRNTQRTMSRYGGSGGRGGGDMYEEEEEGYASGDYDDAPFELVKIRVKLHYKDDVRGMALSPETPFEEFLDKVCAKFGATTLNLKFKDEDGGQVSLRDEPDYELAIETAREAAKGKPEGKLEIWCAT